MSKKLALVLRGISYYDEDRKVCNSASVNYKECYVSFCENLFAPLQTIFDIDIFLLTYNSSKLSELIEDYDPVDIHVYPKELIYHRDAKEITATLLMDSLNMLQDYMYTHNMVYDNIAIVRFDMFYPMKFPLERLKLDSFNFGWLGTYGQCDDCFHMFTPGHIQGIRSYMPFHNIDGYMHGLNHPFKDVNYLCKRGPSDTEYYPDFYIFQRRLQDFNNGKMKLKQVFPGHWNWEMKNEKETVVQANFKHVVIITSCINVSSSPLCYSSTRSVFTPEERLEQTLNSIKTVREKIPNCTIVLMNNNELTNEQHLTLIQNCDYVFIFDSIKLNNILFTADLGKDFPNKNCTEVASLYYACEKIERLKLDYDYLWKLSGRYELLPSFNFNLWLTEPNEGKIMTPPKNPNGGINNVLYCMHKSVVEKYKERLKACFVLCYNDPDCKKGCMVEHTLFSPEDLLSQPVLAHVSGYCSHLADKQKLIM